MIEVSNLVKRYGDHTAVDHLSFQIEKGKIYGFLGPNLSLIHIYMVMPLMSAFFCFTFPVGLGIYWISSAVVRSVQQVLINRHLNKMDIEVLINENMKKIEEKRAKAGLPPQKITNQAHQSVKNINKVEKGNSGSPEAERAKKVEESYKKAAAAKPDSITAKANLVRTFDERNKKK